MNQKDTQEARVASLYEAVSILVTAVIIVAMVFTFVFRLVGVAQSSMEPTLHENNNLLVSAFPPKARVRDIVIITDPNYTHPLVKRVIATGGQLVDIDFEEGKVYVDGVLQVEPYIKEPTNREGDVAFPLRVPEGCVFVLGDNRNDSIDSRQSTVGCVPEKYLLGRVFVRVSPLGQWKVN